MSCVRASDSGNVGFLSDIRRMNVALTRARTSLWILGNKRSLLRNKVWKRLLDDATQRDAVSEAYPGFLKKVFNLRPATDPRAKQIESKREPENDEGHISKRSKTQSTELEVRKPSDERNCSDHLKENSFQHIREQSLNGSDGKHHTQSNETKVNDKGKKNIAHNNGQSNQHIPSSSGTISKPKFNKKSSSIFINKKRP